MCARSPSGTQQPGGACRRARRRGEWWRAWPGREGGVDVLRAQWRVLWVGGEVAGRKGEWEKQAQADHVTASMWASMVVQVEQTGHQDDRTGTGDRQQSTANRAL
eukprot:355368-Chlamydomonas_euryale.AAC.2